MINKPKPRIIAADSSSPALRPSPTPDARALALTGGHHAADGLAAAADGARALALARLPGHWHWFAGCHRAADGLASCLAACSRRPGHGARAP